MRILHAQGNENATIVDAEAPSPGPGEVAIDTAVSALCGSELGKYRGDGWPAGNSGHEAAGTVAQLGEGVSSLNVGDRVGVSAISGCEDCDACRAGKFTWCDSCKFHQQMHAERFVLPASACHKLPDDVAWDVGVLITGDGFGVPYHTSTKILDPDVRTMAVLGAGPIGLGNVIMQSSLGRDVIAVDISAARLEFARDMGAVHTIDAGTEDAAERIRELTGGRGACVCMECAGREPTARTAFAAVRRGGTVVFNGEQGELALSPSRDFIRRDITAFGSWYYHFHEYADMLRLHREGVGIDKLITHHYDAADAPQAFTDFAAGRTGKAILNW